MIWNAGDPFRPKLPLTQTLRSAGISEHGPGVVTFADAAHLVLFGARIAGDGLSGSAVCAGRVWSELLARSAQAALARVPGVEALCEGLSGCVCLAARHSSPTEGLSALPHLLALSVEALAAGAEEDVAGTSFFGVDVAGVIVAIVNVFASGGGRLPRVVRTFRRNFAVQYAVGQFVGILFALGINIFADAQSSDGVLAGDLRTDLSAGDGEERLAGARDDSLFVELVECTWQWDHALLSVGDVVRPRLGQSALIVSALCLSGLVRGIADWPECLETWR